MKIVDLPVEPREKLGSAESRRLRRQGLIPLVLYGGDRPSRHLTTTRDAFGEVLKHHSAVVRLQRAGTDQTALVRSVAWDTFGDYVEHLDLFRVDAEDEVRVRVPIHYFGIPAGKQFGGETLYAMKDIELLVAVKDIPTELPLDLAALNVGDTIHVRDYDFPAGSRPAGHEDELIVQVKAPKVVVEEPEEGEEGEPIEGEPAEADEEA
ncbi:MAG: 50S ribosomal protein L25 [Planctomycetota bacterium]|jgi:large subunit ribosomal protein L25